MKRLPVLYTAALLLSMLGSSVSALFYFSMSIFYNAFSEKIISVTNDLSLEDTSPAYFLLLGSLNVISLVGILKLYKLQVNGLFFYLLGQIGLILTPVILIDISRLSHTNGIFSIIFFLIYLNLYFKLKKSKAA